MLDNIFDIVVSELRDKGVLYAQDMQLRIYIFSFFIFAIFLN